VAGAAVPTCAEVALADTGGAPARQLRGIGAEPSLRPYAVQCQALGLLYVWGNGGQGLLALAQIICGVLTLWGALPLEEESDDRFPL